MSLTGVIPRKKFKSLIIEVVPAPREVDGVLRRYDEDIVVKLKKNNTNHVVEVPLAEGELASGGFDDLWNYIGKLLQESIMEL